jgi:hypothetical protein
MSCRSLGLGRFKKSQLTLTLAYFSAGNMTSPESHAVVLCPNVCHLFEDFRDAEIQNKNAP